MDLNVAVARILLVELVFGVPVAGYVYWDAKRRGDDRPLLRGVGLGLLLIAGLSIHVLRRGPRPVDAPERAD